MKQFILFNIIVFASLAALTAIFLAVYFLLLRRRGAKVKPSVVIAVLLGVALLTSTVGNSIYSSRAYTLLGYFNRNKVDFVAVKDPPDFSRDTIYAEYFDADTIPGYHKHSIDFKEVEVCYYLLDYPEEGIRPALILFAEYKGEDPDHIKWGGGHVTWFDHGEMEGDSYCFGDFCSARYMVLGSIAKNIDEIYFNLDYSGEHWMRNVEFTIPVDVEHIN